MLMDWIWSTATFWEPLSYKMSLSYFVNEKKLYQVNIFFKECIETWWSDMFVFSLIMRKFFIYLSCHEFVKVQHVNFLFIGYI